MLPCSVCPLAGQSIFGQNTPGERIDDLLVFGDTQDIVGMFATFSSAQDQTTV
jgi:hypothetical protein